MKPLFNLFIAFVLIFSLSETGIAAENTQDQDVNKSRTIRIISVNPDSYKGDYDKAIESDPWKGFNLAMFRFNDALDQYFLEPVARSYRFVLPQWGRDRVSSVFHNLGEVRNFVNSIAQGDVEGMFRSFWRAAINTTFGVGGMHDVAAGFGLHEKRKDFSQTLMLYGAGSGPYLVVPFVGPSSPRDFIGLGADIAAEPVTYIDSPTSYILGGVDVIQTREDLLDITDDMRKNSFDLYSSYKSSYLQHRKEKVLDTLE